jgi:hypothetical protein
MNPWLRRHFFFKRSWNLSHIHPLTILLFLSTSFIFIQNGQDTIQAICQEGTEKGHDWQAQQEAY